MQARAIFEAAIAVNDQGFQVFPEIMVPLVGTPQVWKFFLNIFWCLTCIGDLDYYFGVLIQS